MQLYNIEGLNKVYVLTLELASSTHFGFIANLRWGTFG